MQMLKKNTIDIFKNDFLSRIPTIDSVRTTAITAHDYACIEALLIIRANNYRGETYIWSNTETVFCMYDKRSTGLIG